MKAMLPALAVGMMLATPGFAAAKPAMKLTVQDYFEIRELSARYSFVIEHCVHGGYDYADLYTPDGEFGDTGDWDTPPKNISKGPDALAEAAGGGPKGCDPAWKGDGLTHIIVNTVIDPTPTGAKGRSELLILGLNHNPTNIRRIGSYEDTYVKTAKGWRFKTRWHVLERRPPANPQ